MGKVTVLGFLLRIVAVAFVFYIAAIPLGLFCVRAYEGLYEEPLFLYAAIGSALLVFPALIFLGYLFDAATGSIVPLVMLAIIMASHEYTDPEYPLPSGPLLAGRSALVVGASRGIGSAVAAALEARGASVRRVGRGELDLGEAASIRGWLEKARGEGKKYNVAVINSGIYGTVGPKSEEGFEFTANVNLVGIARLVQGLLPLLAPNATVIFSSSASSRNWKGSMEELLDLKSDLSASFPSESVRPLTLYARSKALLNAYTLQLARDHPSIRFLAAFPNPTFTDMVTEVTAKGASDVLHYPWFFAPGSRAFDAFNLFWTKTLTRSVERVGEQYVFGVLGDLPSGCLYFKDSCLKPMPYEVEASKRVFI